MKGEITPCKAETQFGVDSRRQRADAPGMRMPAPNHKQQPLKWKIIEALVLLGAIILFFLTPPLLVWFYHSGPGR